jgi:hypothetical protein
MMIVSLALSAGAYAGEPEIVSVQKIWHQGEHNAFTDLIRFRDRWWCNPPYKQWSWAKLKHRLGGPNFLRIPNGEMWASSRQYGDGATTVLARMTRDSYEPVLTLPSGGDCSYPGMVWHGDLLWISYYSSHEGKSSIYLARIRFKP